MERFHSKGFGLYQVSTRKRGFYFNVLKSGHAQSEIFKQLCSDPQAPTSLPRSICCSQFLVHSCGESVFANMYVIIGPNICHTFSV